MVTEIVRLQVKDSFKPEMCEKSLEYFRPPPAGLKTYRWGQLIDDPQTLIWLMNWDSVQAHEDFMKSSIYPTFVASVLSFCTAPAQLYHTHLQPYPPVKIFDAGIIELSSFAIKPEVSHTLYTAKNANFLDLASKASGFHSCFHGVKHEDPNVNILFIGWDSVESRTAAYTNRDVSRARDALTVLTDIQNSSVYLLRLHSQQ